MDSQRLLFVGNPGVGKSTLLNSIIGFPHFKAGISCTGSGVSSILQELVYQGQIYIDTPGLADVQKRQQCATEITTALKKGGLYCICFVITTEAGRLLPSHRETVRLILESAPQIGNQYSIVVNKLPALVHRRWAQEDPGCFPNMFFHKFPDFLKSTSIYYLETIPDLEGDNKLLTPAMVQGLTQWLKTCPVVTLHPHQVSNIREEPWDQTLSYYQQALRDTEAKAKRDQEEFDRQMAEQRRQNEEAEKRRMLAEAAAQEAQQLEIERLNAKINPMGAIFAQNARLQVYIAECHHQGKAPNGAEFYLAEAVRMGHLPFQK